MITTHETAPPLLTVDEHPHVIRQTRERQELETKLQAALERRGRLIEELDQLQRDRREATVANLLGDAPPLGDTAAQDRLAALNADIEASDAFVVAVRDAMERHAVIAAGVRRNLERERDQHVVTQVRDLFAEMSPLVERVGELNAQLYALLGRVSGSVERLPLPLPTLPELFTAWVRQLDAQK